MQIFKDLQRSLKVFHQGRALTKYKGQDPGISPNYSYDPQLLSWENSWKIEPNELPSSLSLPTRCVNPAT